VSRLLQSLALLVALFAAFLAVPVAQASAQPLSPHVSCSGYGCDHQDPVATGCSAGSYTVTSAPITLGGTSYGTVELRWSPTCQTNWSRVTVASGGSNPNRWYRYAEVDRVSPYAYDWYPYNGTGSPVYGNMLYAPGCAYALGTIQVGTNSWATGSAFQPGC